MTQPIEALVVDGCVVAETSRAPVAWWSFTKTLIAALALDLHGRGVLDLDAPMADPRYTLRQTLRHSAGLPNYGGMAAYHAAVAACEAPWSDDEVLERVGADRLVFAPGTGWAYSSVGYLLARRRVEHATGKGLGALLDAFLFEPLGLATSYLAGTRDDMAGLAFPPKHSYDPDWAYHGTVIGPAADAALCLDAVLGSDLLDEAARAALLDRHALGGPIDGRPWLEPGYGTGLMMGLAGSPKQSAEIAGHSAGGPGSRGAVYRLAGQRRQPVAAVFGAFETEAPAEAAALRLIIEA